MTTAPAGSAKERELRQRAAAVKTSDEDPAGEKDSPAIPKPSEYPPIAASRPWLDVLRVVAGLLLLAGSSSFCFTLGRTWTWGLVDAGTLPSFLSLATIQRRFQGPLRLTNDELAHYDGSDGTPIYLALNRTIYDVSSSPHVYGPGGIYSQLAAKDASRSYITTCFDPVEDLVPYFGGVEEIYVPLWLSRTASKDDLDAIGTGSEKVMGGLLASDMLEQVKTKIGKKNLRVLTEEVYEQARQRVRDQVRTWEGMFEKKGYPVVGSVVGVDEQDPAKWRHLGFCDAAKKQRPPVTESMGRAMELMGKNPGQMNLGDMAAGKGGAGGAKADGTAQPKKGKRSKDDKQKKQKKQKKTSGGGGQGPGRGSNMAGARIEDLNAGGKYSPGEEQIESMIKGGPMGGDSAKAREAVEALKQDKGSEKLVVPDGVPRAAREQAREKAEL